VKKRTLYAVGALKTEIEIESSWGLKAQTLPLDWADGMVGVIPLFSNRKKAERYADKRFPIIVVESERP